MHRNFGTHSTYDAAKHQKQKLRIMCDVRGSHDVQYEGLRPLVYYAM
jgi:hypothetical protein